MEEEERPRKYPKLENDAQPDGSEPVMTGALDDEAPAAAATADADAEPQEAAEEKNDDGTPKLSKNQLKKQRRQAHWEAKRADRKARRKDENKAKRERRRQALQAAEAESKEAADALRKQWMTTKQRLSKSTMLPITIVLDCGFDDLMTEKERTSLASQVTRCYSDNSRSLYRSHLMVSSFNKLLKERFETVLAKTHENWKGVRLLDGDYMEAAGLAKEDMVGTEGGAMAGAFADQADAKPEDGEVVYLSSESPDTLTDLKPYSTYIIGGLVDRNRHKGICYKQAVERGIKTAKLPIGDYIQMASRQVLATNHVMEIMLHWLEVKDWGEAFMKVIPQRKGGTLKEAEEHEQEQAESPGQAENEEEEQKQEEQGAES